jgi:hypothetical protein
MSLPLDANRHRAVVRSNQKSSIQTTHTKVQIMKSKSKLPPFLRVDLRFVPASLHDELIELLLPVADKVGLVTVRKSKYGPLDICSEGDAVIHITRAKDEDEAVRQRLNILGTGVMQ